MVQDNTGRGIAGFVLSIVGIIFFFLPYLAIACSILAIYFSVRQKHIKPTGLATAGLVMGIIGTVINGFLLLILILLGGTMLFLKQLVGLVFI